MYTSYMAGVGHYVPERVVTNDDLAAIIETSDAWIRERTGIAERRYAEVGKDTIASMSAAASRMALERAGLEVGQIGLVVMANITPDYYFPGSGVLMTRELGMGTTPSIDIRAQCTGFIYALSVADQFIRTGAYEHVLVVGAEIQSTALDMTTRGRNTAVIFGDGAGAAVLSRGRADAAPHERQLYSTHLYADGTYAEELCLMDPGSSRPHRDLETMPDYANTRVHMAGNAVFKHAVTRFPEVIREAVERNGYSLSDIELLVPHQANERITHYVAQDLGLPLDRVMSNIARYGNTTAASIPIALSEAFEQGRMARGQLVCLAAFGSGFTWGSALLRF